MFGLGFGEVIVVLVIALIFIGPKKLPELARSLGQGMRELQKASKTFTDQIAQEADQLKTEIKTEVPTQVTEVIEEVPHEKGPDFVDYADQGEEIKSPEDPKKPV
jgi:sec-independent protein translocase protein TatA